MNMKLTAKEWNMAELVFNYLYQRDQGEKGGLIIGFGHFDMKIPAHCAELYQSGYAERILFTGGRGAGSADLDCPEGIAFYNHLRKNAPGIPEQNVIVESNSTNTAENVLFSQRILAAANQKFCFGMGIGSVLAVASPYRQRRVALTIKKQFPQVKIINVPPETTLNDEIYLFSLKKQDLITYMVSEVQRLQVYSEKGYIAYEEVPADVLVACDFLN